MATPVDDALASDDPEHLRAALEERQRRVEALEAERCELIDRLRNHQRARFGASSERAAVSQLTDDLLDPMEPADQAALAEAPLAGNAAPARQRGESGPRARQPLPAHFERISERHDFDEPTLATLREANGGALEELSVEVTDTLEYRPGEVFVTRHELPRYGLTDTDGERTVVSPPLRSAPIPGAQVGASLLAHVAVGKVVDHLPLNRMSQQFARDGIDLSRQRLDDYLLATARAVEPLAERLREAALASPVLHSDDTPVPQRERGRRTTRTARIWAYLGRGRDDGALIPFFTYTSDRKQAAPLAMIGDYSGYLQADAYPGYRNADRLPDGPRWVACWAHARRGFEKVARKQRHRGRSAIALKLIRALYQLETRLERDGVTDPGAIAAARQARAVPILKRLHAYLDNLATRLTPKTELGSAVQYALNQWAELVRYTEDGRLEPDNNRCERLLRGVCVGRKNWMFTGAKTGGDALATLLTVIEACRLNGINPRDYLIDVLRRIQDYPVNRLDELLPHHWASLTLTG